MTNVLLLIFGLVLLVVGAEALVRGASRLASVIGISPLVVGLTVVAYGTSAPEMAVSVMSGLAGRGDISLGNVLGSNIFNVLFILGVSALIVPLFVSQRLVRFDVPLMIFVSIVTLFMGLDGKIGLFDGMILFAGAVTYTIFLILQSRRENRGTSAEPSKPENGGRVSPFRQWAFNTGLIVAGLGLLVVGSQWLVKSAVFIAQYLGLSELIIGLTIVAGGTSLPEVATSIVASLRGERDIAVGNVVGSNIFNILGVLGLSGIVAPEGIRVSGTALQFDIPVMIAAAIACLPIFFTGSVIARWEGALFLGYYITYTLYLLLKAVQHEAVRVFSAALIWFVIPLTVITLMIVTARSIWGRPGRGGHPPQ